MNIKDVLEIEDDGYPLAALNKCKIKSIKPPDHEKNLQNVYLDQDGDSIRLVIKSANLYLKDGDIGKQVSLRAGKPVGGQPVGLTVKITDDKRRIVLSKDAAIIIGEADKPEPKAEKVPLTEKDFSDDSLEHKTDDFIPGPNDAFIAEFLAERTHIWNVLNANNAGNHVMSFSDPWITGIHIEMGKMNKKILPLKAHKAERFKEEPKIVNQIPKTAEASGPMDPTTAMKQFIKSNPSMFKGITAPDGTPMADMLLDHDRRGKMCDWYFTTLVQKNGKAGKYQDLYNLLDELSKNKEVYSLIAMSAMLYDYCNKNEVEYSMDIEDKFTDEMNKSGKFKAGSLRVIAMEYYKKPVDSDED